MKEYIAIIRTLSERQEILSQRKELLDFIKNENQFIYVSFWNEIFKIAEYIYNKAKLDKQKLNNIISDENVFKQQIELAKNGKFFTKENNDFLREKYNYEN